MNFAEVFYRPFRGKIMKMGKRKRRENVKEKGRKRKEKEKMASKRVK